MVALAMEVNWVIGRMERVMAGVMAIAVRGDGEGDGEGNGEGDGDG